MRRRQIAQECRILNPIHPIIQTRVCHLPAFPIGGNIIDQNTLHIACRLPHVVSNHLDSLANRALLPAACYLLTLAPSLPHSLFPPHHPITNGVYSSRSPRKNVATCRACICTIIRSGKLFFAAVFPAEYDSALSIRSKNFSANSLRAASVKWPRSSCSNFTPLFAKPKIVRSTIGARNSSIASSVKLGLPGRSTCAKPAYGSSPANTNARSICPYKIPYA